MIYTHKLNLEIEPILGFFQFLQSKGKQAYIVGGAVRDGLLGISSKDIDIEVYKINYHTLESYLYDYIRDNKLITHLDFVGKQFGVLKCSIDGVSYDFAIPRTESKVGVLHTDFDVTPNPNLSLEEACSRRDFTINALAYNPLTGEIHDFFGGVDDLEDSDLYPTSDKFVEDPLRVLRGMQFSCRFALFVTDNLIEVSQKMADEIEAAGYEYGTNQLDKFIAKERVAEEFMKWSQSKHPELILEYLLETGWIRFFPEIRLLHDDLKWITLCGKPLDPAIYKGQGVIQDEIHHPEGNVWNHTRQVLKVAAEIAEREGLEKRERAILLIAALLHDLGKCCRSNEFNPCTQIIIKGGRHTITSHGHDFLGAQLAPDFFKITGLSKDIETAVVALIAEHMSPLNCKTDKSINRLSKRLNKAGTNISLLMMLVEADYSGRSIGKVQSIGLGPKATRILQRAKELKVVEKPPVPLLMGRDIIFHFPEVQPGPLFGKILNAIYELQLDGKITTREQALEYARSKIQT